VPKPLTTIRLERGCVRYDAVIDIEGGPETLARIGPDAFMIIEQWESEMQCRRMPHLLTW
jgi:quinol monooxygenase YgiN